jgi:hypothetical protein
MNLNKYGAVIEYTDDPSTISIEQLIEEDRLGVTLNFLNTNMHTSFVDVSAAHEYAKLHFPELLI